MTLLQPGFAVGRGTHARSGGSHGCVGPCGRVAAGRRLPPHRHLPPSHQRACCTAAAAQRDGSGPSTSGSASSPSKRAEVEANVNKAAKFINDIVEEVTKEMFLAEAVAYLQEDEADQTEAMAIRNAVMKRIEFLDSTFMTALNGFIHAASSTGDQALAQLLHSIREEILAQVGRRLPSAALALDIALREEDKDARVAVLRKALSGGGGELPGVEMDTLAATASQFIDEMEEQPEVLDRRLLARLCLLREELRIIQQEDAFSDPSAGGEFTRANVPQRCAAFLKELVAVNDPLRRLGLLDKALQNDWDGAAPKAASPSGAAAPDSASPKDQPDYVRPGRFLATLNSTVRHLEQAGDGNAGVLHRLEQIRSEALVVLDRMHRGRRSSGGGHGGSEASEAAPAGAGGASGSAGRADDDDSSVIDVAPSG